MRNQDRRTGQSGSETIRRSEGEHSEGDNGAGPDKTEMTGAERTARLDIGQIAAALSAGGRQARGAAAPSALRPAGASTARSSAIAASQGRRGSGFGGLRPLAALASIASPVASPVTAKAADRPADLADEQASFEEQLEAELVADLSGYYRLRKHSGFGYDDLLSKSEHRIHQNCEEIKELHKQADEDDTDYADGGDHPGNHGSVREMTDYLRKQARPDANRATVALGLRGAMAPVANVAILLLCLTIGGGAYYFPEILSRLGLGEASEYAQQASSGATGIGAVQAAPQAGEAVASDKRAATSARQAPENQASLAQPPSKSAKPVVSEAVVSEPVVREVASKQPAARNSSGKKVIVTTVRSARPDKKPAMAPVQAEVPKARQADRVRRVELTDRFASVAPEAAEESPSLLRGYLPGVEQPRAASASLPADQAVAAPKAASSSTPALMPGRDGAAAEKVDTGGRDSQVVQLAMRAATGMDALDMAQRQALAARLVLGECVGESLRQVAGRVSPLLVRDMMRSLDGKC
jgi:hypothetical protein